MANVATDMPMKHLDIYTAHNQTSFVPVEKGKPMCKVEFIESYIRVGNDYQWNDNHGELIRCKDCKYFYKTNVEPYCALWSRTDTELPKETDFCSWAERKTDEC